MTGRITSLTYDSQGQAVSITDPRGKMSNLRSVTDPLGRETNLIYDDLDRLTRVNYPAAQTGGARLFERYQYDAVNRLTVRFDTAGRDTRYFYDTGDRLIQFDDASQITQIAELAGTRNYSYDMLNRLTAATRPNQAAESYAYDAVGNRTASHLSASYGYLSFSGVPYEFC